MKPLRLGLKYCGGCSSRYDRVAWVDELKEKTAGKIEFVAYDDPRAEAILVVMGCESACVDLTPFRDKPHYLIWRESQMMELIQLLEGFN